MVSDLIEKLLFPAKRGSTILIFCRAAEWSIRYD